MNCWGTVGLYIHDWWQGRSIFQHVARGRYQAFSNIKKLYSVMRKRSKDPANVAESESYPFLLSPLQTPRSTKQWPDSVMYYYEKDSDLPILQDAQTSQFILSVLLAGSSNLWISLPSDNIIVKAFRYPDENCSG